jgi:hypothetical protein
MTSFDLLWLPFPLDDCLYDGTPLEAYEVEVELVGPSTQAFGMVVLDCGHCGQWYGIIPVLGEMTEQLGWGMEDVEEFRIEGEPVDTGVVLGEAPMAWPAFAAHVGEMEAAQSGPTPSVEEVAGLEQRDVTWEVGQEAAVWIGEGDDPDVGFAALVHGPDVVRAHKVDVEPPFDAEALAELVRRAAGSPLSGASPERPATVRVADAEMADDLRPLLAAMDIDVEVGPTDRLDETLAGLTLSLSGEMGPAVFAGEDETVVRDFLDTATRFYEADPWTRTEGDRFLGVQIDDGDWFFANVMGQLGESPGLSVFDDWLVVCTFIHNQYASVDRILAALGLDDGAGVGGDGIGGRGFEAAGALEALSLRERTGLHPADAYYFDTRGIEPPVDGEYPVPTRFDVFEGPTAPHFDLDAYRVTMEAIRVALERRTATPVTSIKTTIDVGGTDVSLRYPSEGEERPYDGPAGYRLVVHGDEDMIEPSRIPPGTQLIIDAPATTLVKDVAKAVKQTDDDFYEVSFQTGQFFLWDDRGRRRDPSPRVADLTRLGDHGLEVGGARFSLTIDQALDDAPDEIRVRREDD